jgi:hypothetical protein
MIKEDDVLVLDQLVGGLENAVSKLEEYYSKKDVDKLNQTKKFILVIQEKISEVTS